MIVPTPDRLLPDAPADGKAWRDNAEQLARWVMERTVNRTDVWGAYLPKRQRKDCHKAITLPQKSHRGIRSLLLPDVERHFSVGDQGDVLGFHALSEDGRCKWFAIDIDKHDNNDHAEINERAAHHWADKFTGMGFHPLIEDSDGRGGYHVFVFLSEPVTAARVYPFVSELVDDFADIGLATRPETFPKQSKAEFGNWLRCPGRHHTREHFSKFWDGARWLDGEDAVRVYLDAPLSDASLIPEAPKPKLSQPYNPADANRFKDDPDQDRRVALKCLDGLNVSRADDHDDWIAVGMAMHAVDPYFLVDWERWSQSSGKFRQGECEKRWASFKSQGNGGDRGPVGIGSLVKRFKNDNGGQVPPSMQKNSRAFGATGNGADTGNSGIEGNVDPIVLDPQDPMASARVFVAERCTKGGVYTIRSHQGETFRFNGKAYERVDSCDLKTAVYRFAEASLREIVDKTGEVSQAPFKPNSKRVSEIIDAMGAVVAIDSKITIPAWLDDYDGPDPDGLLICANGALDWRTGRLRQPDPRLFVVNYSPVAFEADAAEPTEWLRFLDDLWPDDLQSIELLQDWFGYCLTQDTRHHKILLLVGPKRSGKGTICRILRGLLGKHSVSSPMMSTLGGPFGLQPLIGTQLAIMEDARLRASTNAAAVAERLLTISGEDSPDISRKHLPDWRGRLRTRFMLVSNELPNLGDASGAVASRFVLLRTEKSYFGSEDLGLIDGLCLELPGILNWTIDGLSRLNGRGRFVQPTTSADDLEALAEMSSPVAAFVKDRCILRPDARVSRADLFRAWLEWCKDQGRDHPTTAATFGRDLHAALPEVRDIRPKDGTNRQRAYSGIELAYVPEV